MTARTLIRRALMLIGVLAEGENPSAEALSDGILALNDLLGSWSAEGLMIPTVVREEFALTVGQASRTIGVGGNFNTTRPIVIEKAMIEIQSSSPTVETQLQLLTLEQYAGIVAKDSSGFPTQMYIAGTNPLETVYLWPVPSVADKLVIYSQKPLTSIATANDTIDMAPPYARCLRFNLAMELAAEYGKATPAEVVKIAAEAKGNVKRLNITQHHLLTDEVLMTSGGYNIITGV